MTLLFRIFLCIFFFWLCLYRFVDKQNEVIELRLAIPQLQTDVRMLEEENARLQYDIDRFESPGHLIELSRMPEYGYLKNPYLRDIRILDPQVEWEEADG